jgi:hypothetical protein
VRQNYTTILGRVSSLFVHLYNTLQTVVVAQRFILQNSVSRYEIDLRQISRYEKLLHRSNERSEAAPVGAPILKCASYFVKWIFTHLGRESLSDARNFSLSKSFPKCYNYFSSEIKRLG